MIAIPCIVKGAVMVYQLQGARHGKNSFLELTFDFNVAKLLTLAAVGTLHRVKVSLQHRNYCFLRDIPRCPDKRVKYSEVFTSIVPKVYIRQFT